VRPHNPLINIIRSQRLADSKSISPFGFLITWFGRKSLRARAKKRYAGIMDGDHLQRTYATSVFLYDFALDLSPAISLANDLQDTDAAGTEERRNMEEGHNLLSSGNTAVTVGHGVNA